MEKKISSWDYIFRQILVLGMWGMICHSTACILYNVISEKTLWMDLSLLTLYIPLYLFAIIRSRCGNFFLFLLFHAASGGIFMLFFEGIELKIIMGGCVTAMIITSFVERMRPYYLRGQSPTAFCIILFLAVYGTAYVLGRRAVMQISYYEAFVFLILFVVHRSLRNTSKFLKLNEGMQNMPSREIKGMSRMLLTVFVLFFTAGMILLQNMPVGQLLTAAGTMMKNIMRRLFLLIIQLLSGEGEEAAEKAESVGQELMMPAAAGEAPVFLQVLEQIIKSALYIGLAAAGVYLTAKVLYAVYKRFYAQQNSPGDESEFLWQNSPVKERIASIKRKKEHWEGGSLNQKMRYVYKKYIRKKAGKKTVIPAAYTPWELENSISADEKGQNAGKDHTGRDTALSDAACLRIRLYEKARYSSHACTRQDLNEMKKMLKS